MKGGLYAIRSHSNCDPIALKKILVATDFSWPTAESSRSLENKMKVLISHMVPPSCRVEYVVGYGDEAKAIKSVAHEVRADLVVMGLRDEQQSSEVRSPI
jgi:hypothetical protein